MRYPPGQGLISSLSPRVVSSVVNEVIASTAATKILTYTPGGTEALRISIGLAIVTAATMLTATITWTDPNAGAQSYSWYSAQNVSVGTPIQLPVMILAASDDQVSINVTAGTANQVFVTALIEKLI